MIERLRSVAKSLKREARLYRVVLRHSRTPLISKILLGFAMGYALFPFDLIPDWIPIIGHLDDMVIVPLLVIIALKFIPPGVVQECRKDLDDR